MNWQSKAKIMKACALLPAGGGIYRFIQKTFGRLKAYPMARLPMQIEMARWILEMDGKVEEKTFFEVGTGHNPIMPIGFFLCRAEQVVTVDLNRRLDLGILEESLVWMAENRDEICGYYDGVVEGAVFDPQISQITQISNHLKDEGITCHNPLNAKSIGFNFPAPCCDGKDKAAMSHKIFIERMDMIDRLKHKPEKLLTEANIVYLAPANAANTDLPDASIDYHISTTVFEHIPGEDIERILKEAKRILKKDGTAIHFIDLSDHFQHQDKSITSINFLRYSEKEWDKIAGNEFAYCNRLRASDYLALFKEVGFDVFRFETQKDDEARQSIKDGFEIDERFREYSVDDLCVTGLRVALRVKRNKERRYLS